MFLSLIFVVFLLTLDAVLLSARVKPRSLLIGHCAVALLIVGVCALRSDFDLGPIEIRGWMAGLIIAGVSLSVAFVFVGFWCAIGGSRDE